MRLRERNDRATTDFAAASVELPALQVHLGMDTVCNKVLGSNDFLT